MTGRVAVDKYPQDLAQEQSEPWHEGFPVVPDDNNELPFVTRSLYVGGGGDINLILVNGASLFFANAAPGFCLGLRVRKVLKSSTTATNLVGLY